MMRKRLTLVLLFLLLAMASSYAGFTLFQFGNDTVPAGGFIVNDSSALLLDDVGGSLYAR